MRPYDDATVVGVEDATFTAVATIHYTLVFIVVSVQNDERSIVVIIQL